MPFPPRETRHQSRATETATADATGAATITVGPRPGQSWTVEQIAISSTSTVSSSCSVTVNGRNICSTPSGNSDTADGAPAIYLSFQDQLEIVWTGAGPNSQCEAIVYYVLEMVPK